MPASNNEQQYQPLTFDVEPQEEEDFAPDMELEFDEFMDDEE